MHRKERLAILKKWEDTTKELHKQWDKHGDLLSVDAPFANAIFFIEAEYTNAVEAMLGIDPKQLGWWQYENEYGKRGFEVGTCDEDMRPMKTLRQYERFLFPDEPNTDSQSDQDE